MIKRCALPHLYADRSRIECGQESGWSTLDVYYLWMKVIYCGLVFLWGRERTQSFELWESSRRFNKFYNIYETEYRRNKLKLSVSNLCSRYCGFWCEKYKMSFQLFLIGNCPQKRNQQKEQVWKVKIVTLRLDVFKKKVRVPTDLWLVSIGLSLVDTRLGSLRKYLLVLNHDTHHFTSKLSNCGCGYRISDDKMSIREYFYYAYLLEELIGYLLCSLLNLLELLKQFTLSP